MKKFIASENVVFATSRKFKESIDFAVKNTEKGHNFTNSSHGKKFVGTTVTFNADTNEVDCFDLYDYIDITNESKIKVALSNQMNRIIENDKYKQNEFIVFIKASDFEYHGYVGYPSKQEQEVQKLKMENKSMSIYIDIITKSNENDAVIEDLELSIRTHSCLKRAGVDTTQQIKEMTRDQVMRIRNLGRNSFDELERVLGITFA